MKGVKIFGLSLTLLVLGCSKSGTETEPPIDPPGTGTPNPEPVPTALAIDSLQTFDQILDGWTEANRLGLSFPFSDFEPTGVYLKPNALLEVEVTIDKAPSNSAMPSLLVGTYSRGTDWNHSPVAHPLKEGKNTIRIGAEGGMAYVQFLASENPDGQVSLKFEKGWEHTPMFKKGETTNAIWKEKLNYFKEAPSVTLEGDRSFLVVSRSKAIEYQNEDQDGLLTSIDEVIEIEQKVSGMDADEGMHRPMSHKLLFSEYLGSDYYMFAFFFRTAYRQSDAVQFILDESAFENDGWGPWHEIGHMHQMNAWTWNAVVEATVNIYSLAVEREMGISPNRLERDGIWQRVSDYLALPEDQKDFNGGEVDVWMRLAMFHQLWLAYGEEFYPNLHKSIREEKPAISNDEDRMRTFMLHASKISGNDLSAFFKKWGMVFNGSDGAYQQIEDLQLPDPETDLSTLTD